ncbi:MAG: bifunctional folylpolyglutamate synthase/dihydrofolate synthase [Acidobacteria bacterium]|nr:bifunctional folylpolyglutamate synthase/dihydrofolate synthase [Acidobacteriota bacterium]
MSTALDRLYALETFGIKLGLENISRLCAALGHPEQAFTSIHVAGTNGKGSVTAMAHAGLVAGGVRAGRFVSPHLVDLAERFVIGSKPVAAADLEQTITDVLDCADALKASGTLSVHPTFFEATTAVAFELFRRARVEVAVIEVGLGGRFDSTNIIRAPIGAITSIGLDHQDLLGDTIEAIAYEKAGIIKPGMTVVTGSLPGEARTVVAAVARDRQADLVEADSGAHVEGEVHDGRATITITTPGGRYGPIRLALRGEHQIGNALVAVRVLEALQRTGRRVPGEAIERGLTDVEWPGRLELIEVQDGPPVLLDAAHNVDGAAALAAYLKRWHPERPTLVIGVMHDKDVAGIIGALLPAVSSVVATAAETPRALPARELAARVTAGGSDVPVRVEPDPVTAVEEALATGRTVCVTGSIYLVGAVRDRLRRRAILR